MTTSNATILRECIQKVATGPEYSKDLSFDEAYQAMQSILQGNAEAVQIAIFFIALRMKRETDEENRGILQAIIDNAAVTTCAVDEVIDIADAYDGHLRGLPCVAFIPAVLAACGIAACSHGVHSVGPKFGITSHRILKYLDIAVDLSPNEAAERINNPDIAWSYVDQKQYCPALYDLLTLRQTMVKRQVLTTVEVLIGPLRGKQHTHLMTGYVHKAYPPIYDTLAKQAGFSSLILVRGVEGGVIPSLQQDAKVYYSTPQIAQDAQIFNPKDVDIQQTSRAVPLPKPLPPTPIQEDITLPFDINAVANIAAETGLDALKGKKGAAYDALVYSSAIALYTLKKSDSMLLAAEQVRKVLDSGKAFTYFNAH